MRRMKLTMLGTGQAMVTKCYNTCFIMEEAGRCFLVDCGGGNTILSRLNQAGFQWLDIRDVFVTHKHLDHILGALWMIRAFCEELAINKMTGDVNFYGHDEVIALLRDMATKLLKPSHVSFIDSRIHMNVVEDGETREIIGFPVTFFDIHSTKDKQFGFCIDRKSDGKICCCGDEPFQEHERIFAEGSKWLLHEAFCLASEADIFTPYEFHHSTVKDACKVAQRLGVPNVILYHTEDSDLPRRKERYKEEGEKYFDGNIFVPDDLEVIEL